MNSSKTSSYGKLIAFFVVAVALICALGFAAGGWQSEEGSSENGESTNDTANNDNEHKNDSGNINAPNDGADDSLPTEPKYFDMLTGVETTKEDAERRPIAFVMDSGSPLYGVSEVPLMIELPIEGGYTRLISFSTNGARLGKIGSLCKTRGYINNFAKYFDAIAVYAGVEGNADYVSCDISDSSFDLSQNVGYHYTEYTEFLYTNGDLIKAGLTNADLEVISNAKRELPYSFSAEDERISLAETAVDVTVSYSDTETVLFSYSDEDGKYVMKRDGEIKKDLLSDKAISFDNLFVLFADAITYESAESSELVMKTVGGGTGYYITSGTRVAITWCATENGDLLFQTSDGEKLVVNRGSSYIGVVKSSMYDSVVFP